MTLRNNIIACIIWFKFSAVLSSTLVDLTLLSPDKYPQAKCLDGSPAGYYFDNKFTDKFVFYLEGGGECDTESTCKAVLNSSTGSSHYFSASSDSVYWYLASGNCDYNPALCSYNHVDIPYCSQDLFSGQRTDTNATWGLYFSGHLILQSIFDEFDALYGLKNATEIIFTGASAGGLGAFINIDYVSRRYPNARVTIATVAGFYFYEEYYTGRNAATPPCSGFSNFLEPGWENMYTLYDAYVTESCKAYMLENDLPVSGCMIANISLPFVESDVYAIQAQTDQVVLEDHDCFPGDHRYESDELAFLNIFHGNMTVALSPLFSNGSTLETPTSAPLAAPTLAPTAGRRTGAFSAACYLHTGFNHAQPLIRGINFYQAFANFYFNVNGTVDPSLYLLQDDCGVMCNPTCPAV